MRPSPRGPRPILGILLLIFCGTSSAGTINEVVINEIMQNPSAVADSAGEWFELYNPGGSPVDIDGWTIEDQGSDNHVINNGGPLLIPAGGYLVLGNNSDTGTNGGVTVDYNYGGSWFLANGDDEIIILDTGMMEVDSVMYDGGLVWPDPTGASMSLLDPGLDNSVGTNWCASTTPFGAGDLGTPGAANTCEIPPPEIVINEVMQNPSAVTDGLGEWFELYNAGENPVDIDGWTIQDNDSDSHLINNGGPLVIPAGGYLVLGNNADMGTNGGVAVDYNYGGSFFLANGADELVLIDGSMAEIDRIEWDGGPIWPDPNGATMSLIGPALDNNDGTNWCEAMTPFGAGDLGTPGAANDCLGPPPEVVINEVMQNPSAVTDGLGEWFELYNAGDSPVDIDGWTIQDNDSDSHLINNGGPLVIPAGGYLVLGNNADMGTNGGVAVGYNYGGSFFLANGADELVLVDGSMAEVDRIEWDGGPIWPDPNGASMSLIDPALDNNDGTNWCEATTPYGAGDLGTPGALNDCEGGPVQLLINEVDADTSGTDTMEFVEIYDGGAGNTSLDGLVVVFFNGNGDTSYAAFDLDGMSTDADGYFSLCNAAVAGCGITFADNSLQNGADAVALYMDDATSFPNGTAATTTNLIDALVYGTNDSDDAELLALLNAGQPQVNESGGAGGSANDSNQRCPNGSGGPRNTDSYEQWPPTPGAENVCMAIVLPPMCGETGSATLIHDIQGTTDTSPLLGMEVEVEGIVVGDLQGPNEYGGLFIQEENLDADANPLTSEGIFAFTSIPADLGDQVRVRGTVAEFNGLTELSPTTDVVICDTGVALPTPAMPTLPMSAPDEFEAFESMYVLMPQPLVINDVFVAFRFGELTVSSTRRVQPTVAAAPGAPANAVADANALDALIIDDRRTGQNLAPPIIGQDDMNPIAADNPIRDGQIVTGLTGVMHYAFGDWRVQPTAPFVIDETGNLRTPSPAPVGGTLKVASFNVLNFFTTLDTGAPICGPLGNLDCRGANSPEEYDRQLAKLVAAISAIDADVFGLMELENNASDSIQALTDAVNLSVGAGTYDFIDTGTIGGDAIKVGFIYKPASVTPEGNFALLTSAVDPRFNDSLNRPSLAQSFRATSNLALFTPIVNHLKSKGCGGATGPDEDQGDGQSCFNATRTSAAEALRDWANGDPTGTGADPVLIIGDLNSYGMEDPIQTLVAGGLTDLEPAFGGPDAYSYVFSGQAGSLDHALSTVALTPKVTGAVPWNINADEMPALDYNTEFGVLPSFYAPTPYRSSDHDPIVVGLELNPPSSLTIPTTAAGADALIEISGAGDKCGFSSAEFVDAGSLSPAPPANLEFPYGVLTFTAEHCSVGATATIEVTLPAIPDFLAWLKQTLPGGWTLYPYVLDGNTFSFQVTDGGMGDEDGLANGIFIDPSGPAVVATGQERATFLVTKDFDDDNPAEVEVTLSCNTGLPLEQSAMIAEGEHVEFVLGDFAVGEPDCTVNESVPDGYAPFHDASVGQFGIAGDLFSGDQACSYVDVSNGQFLCQITNTLQPVDITIYKEWIDDNPEYNLPQFAYIELSCGGLGFVGSAYISPGEPGVFSVYPSYHGTICKVKEEQQVGVITDIGDCMGEGLLEVRPGQGDECTVVNTRLYAGIPTLSRFGLLALSVLMLMMGWVAVRRLA